MRSSSAVLGNQGVGPSDMVIRAVVHFMEPASKKCWSAAGFCKLLAALSRGTNRGLTPARACQYNRKLFVLQWLVERCWEFHTPTALDAATVTWFFWLGFAPLAFCQEPVPQGSGVQLCMAGASNSLRYCNTWGTAIPAYPIIYYYIHIW